MSKPTDGIRRRSKELARLWQKVQIAPAVSSKVGILEKLEDRLGEPTITSSVISATISSLSDSTLFEQFIHSIPQLIDFLDDLAKTHVFLAAALAPFKAIYASERKRRENNKRVMLLFIEMRDMMAVVLQIDDIEDPDRATADGQTLMGRLQALVSTIGDEMKQSYNVCEAYVNEGLICKVWKAKAWEDKLVEWAERFVRRRDDLTMALSAHAARGIDENTRRLKALQESVDAIYRHILPRFPSAGEEEISRRIKQVSRETIETSDEELRSLARLEDTYRYSAPSSGTNVDSTSDKNRQGFAAQKGSANARLKDLKNDMNTDVQKVIENNFQVFEGKIRIELQRVEANVNSTVERTGDRVIEALSGGPGDFIANEDMWNIWRYMGWRASVKSAHFVLALRDYYHDSARASASVRLNTAPSPSELDPRPQPRHILDFTTRHSTDASESIKIPHATIDPSDEWTLQYLRVDRLRYICDAIDVDASGFITVNEVNLFTQSRPSNWSLLRWIAYWAVGWEASLVHYASRIRKTLGQMFNTLPRVLVRNRSYVDKYLSDSWDVTMEIVMHLPDVLTLTLPEDYFGQYIADAEERLKANLEKVNYNLTESDTVRVVVEGPLERSILPLLYVLLQRHLLLVKVSTLKNSKSSALKNILNEARWSMSSIELEHGHRAQDVSANFTHQRRDCKQELRLFACGIYQNATSETEIFTPAKLEELDYTRAYEEGENSDYEGLDLPPDLQAIIRTASDDMGMNLGFGGMNSMNDTIREADANSEQPMGSTPEPNSDSAEIKAQDPSEETEPQGHNRTQESPSESPCTDPLVSQILGQWSGYTTAGTDFHQMYVYNFRSSPSGGFWCNGQASDGINFSVSGAVRTDDDDALQIGFVKQYPEEPPLHYAGTLTKKSGEWSGTISNGAIPDGESSPPVKFTLRHVSPEILSHRPSQAEFDVNRVSALWKFAFNVIFEQRRRTLWNWTYFERRAMVRRRCMDLFLMHYLLQNDTTAGREMFQRVLPADFQRYFVTFQKNANDYLDLAPYHAVNCDVCGRTIIGIRVVCIECPRAKRGLIDMCPTTRCAGADIPLAKRSDLTRPHMATHGLLRIPYVLHAVMEWRTMERAKEGLDRAGKVLGLDGNAKPTQESILRKPLAAPGLKAKDLMHRCDICWKAVNTPCWFCIDCEDTVLLCNNCGLGEIHHDNHLLVRYSKKRNSPGDDPGSIEQQLLAFQEKTERILENMARENDERLEKLRDEMQSRLDRIERLLLRPQSGGD